MNDEKELREMRRNLDEQYKKDRETIDRMIELIARAKSAGGAAPASEDSHKGKTLNERIADYIHEIEGNFTMQEAVAFIKEKDAAFASSLKRQSLSTALWKLSNGGDIKVIIPKRGKSAAIYSNK